VKLPHLELAVAIPVTGSGTDRGFVKQFVNELHWLLVCVLVAESTTPPRGHLGLIEYENAVTKDNVFCSDDMHTCQPEPEKSTKSPPPKPDVRVICQHIAQSIQSFIRPLSKS
jgi:hypothetical protein